VESKEKEAAGKDGAKGVVPPRHLLPSPSKTHSSVLSR
jgi:hypothetical protein